MQRLNPDIDERRLQVAGMLLARVRQREMARRLGVSLGTINNDVAAVRAEWLAQRAADYDTLVSEELARLDAAEAAIWAMVVSGKLVAIDRLLAIQDRRARLLGLDAPQRIDIEVKVRELAAEMGIDPELAVQEAEQLLRESKVR